MAESHIISALVYKHSELQGLIVNHKNMIKNLESKLKTISDTIMIFDKSYPLSNIAPKNHRSSYFKRGELTKMILECIKSSSNGVNVNQISDYIFKDREVDREFIDSFKQNIYVALNKLVSRGIVCSESINGVKHYKIKIAD